MDDMVMCSNASTCMDDCVHKEPHEHTITCEPREWRERDGCPERCAAVVHGTGETTMGTMKPQIRSHRVGSKEPKGALTFMPEGLNPDAPIVTNERGGQQSKVDYRFDLLDASAMFRIAKIMELGSHTHDDGSWRKVSATDHINHAMGHMWGYLLKDKQGDHLAHAAVRLMMAMAVSEDK